MSRLAASHPLRRAVAALVALALALSGAGCANPPPRQGSAYAWLEAVVIDAERLARDDELAAQVRVWRGTAPLPVRRGMELQPGDLVQTGPYAYAVLRYSNAEVLMRPGSQGRVGSLTDLIGEVFAKIRGAFAVETSFVRAGAEGTAYLVRGWADGATVVTVFEGNVALSSRVGAWGPQRVATGMTAACPPRGGAPMMRQASVQELEQTRAWVERMERLVPPQRSRVGSTAAAVGVIGVLIGAILIGRDRGDRSDRPAAGTTGGAGTGGAAGTTATPGTRTSPLPATPRVPIPPRRGDDSGGGLR